MSARKARGGKGRRKRPAPNVREVKPDDVIQGSGWKVTVGRAAHLQLYLECLAYRLDGSVCFTGDSGMSDEIAELARGRDMLIP